MSESDFTGESSPPPEQKEEARNEIVGVARATAFGILDQIDKQSSSDNGPQMSINLSHDRKRILVTASSTGENKSRSVGTDIVFRIDQNNPLIKNGGELTNQHYRELITDKNAVVDILGFSIKNPEDPVYDGDYAIHLSEAETYSAEGMKAKEMIEKARKGEKPVDTSDSIPLKPADLPKARQRMRHSGFFASRVFSGELK